MVDMNKKIGIVIGFVLMASFVLALGVGEGCCFLSVNGDNCVISDIDGCAEGSLFAEGVECNQTASCERGCCYDDSSGIYDKNVLQGSCSMDWINDPYCNLIGANLGCCVLGDTSIFETVGQCEVDSLAAGMDVDWRGDLNLVECLLLAGVQKEGACVLEGGACKFTSEADCYSYGGDFAEDYLCTSFELNTSCNMTRQTQCVDGKDGVYFVDSCGNIANIYDAGRVDDASYWNRIIVGTGEICGDGDANGNANSASCGNCNRFDGGICASASEDNFNVDIGDFYCRDTACVFEGESYENGESWCVYDGTIGDGYDIVGSRHWRYVCSQGTVLVEPCADSRREICVQTNNYEVNGTNVSFKSSLCIDNSWAACLALNTGSSGESCDSVRDCFELEVDVDYFEFDVCVPEYPPGFDWNDTEAAAAASTTCDIASQDCLMLFKKNHKLKWECVQNCDCAEQTFTDQMHDFCRSLGDCGSYVNIEEGWSDGGFSVTGGYKRSLPIKTLSAALIAAYKSKTTVVEGDYISPDNYSLGGTGTYLNVLQGADKDRWEDTGMANPDAASGWGDYLMRATSYSLFLELGIGKTLAAILDPIGWYVFKDVKEKYVYFTCSPWTPPAGGADCEKCNGDPWKPCSDYRCHSLGAACKLMNKGSAEELCISDVDDGRLPAISLWADVISGGVAHDEGSSGFSLRAADGGCLDAYIPIVLGVTTSELARCKFDGEMIDFENMTHEFGSNLYLYNHSVTIELPDLSHGQSQGYNWTSDYSLYVKCEDTHGHESSGFYTIDMCLKEGEDTREPVIRSVSPENDGIVGFETVSQDLEVRTNELSTCRWDFQDRDYSLMVNEMVCDDVFGAPSNPFGYVCSSVLPVNVSSTYYIRCMDQPWLDGLGNANVRSYVLNLRKPDFMILIGKVRPEGVIVVGTAMTTIELKVATSGGGDSHTCSYSFSGYDRMIEMFETGGTKHIQVLSRPAGKNKAYIECVDETGDFNRNFTEFEIIRDSSSPLVARVWQNGNTLYFITEDSEECRYSTESCQFGWENASSAGGGDRHSISAMHGQTYYVKCMDDFGNVPSACSIVTNVL
ncbi:hypothetical protein K8R30_00490 [archaeon]|nr:hypothetical protein [archaeon]